VVRTLYPAVKAGNLGAIDRWLRTIDTVAALTGANASRGGDDPGMSAFLSVEERMEKILRFVELARARARAAAEEGQVIDITPIETLTDGHRDAEPDG